MFFPLQNVKEAEQRSLLHRPQDLLFVIYLIPAFAFCVFRGLVRTKATQNIIFIPPILSYSNSLEYRLLWTVPASGPRTIRTIMSLTWKTHRPILGCRYVCLHLPHSASLNKHLMQIFFLLIRCWWACCIQRRTTLLHFMDWWCRDVNGCQTWLLCTQEHWHRYVCIYHETKRK